MHKWHLVSIASVLVFFGYSERQLEGVKSSAWSDIIFARYFHSLQELFCSNRDLFNVMFSWSAGSSALFIIWMTVLKPRN